MLILGKGYSQDCNIYFDFNSDVMRINDVGKLQELVNKYSPNKQVSYTLSGNADTVGNSQYNIDLSRRRAKAIKNYLIQNNIDSNSIEINFFGEQKVISTDQFYNRRVEVYVVEKGDLSEEKTYQQFMKSIKPAKEVFNIPTNAGVVVEGKKGTVISFPQNAFTYSNGKTVDGNVHVELTEYYSMTDFFSDRLSTVSNGNLLTSGGMIFIKVLKDTNELILKEGADIEIAFPKSFDKQFYTFYGERLPDGSMNWQSDKRQLAGNKQKSQEMGITISDDGNSLIVTDLKTAEERNESLQLDRTTGGFRLLNAQEKMDLKKYFEEQKKIDANRAKYYNILKSSKLNYINCDEYNRDPSGVFVNFTLEIEDSEIVCLSSVLIFKNTNGMLEMQKLTNQTCSINARMPLKEPVRLLVVGQYKDQIYLYHKQIQLAENMNQRIAMSKGSQEELKNILKL